MMEILSEIASVILYFFTVLGVIFFFGYIFNLAESRDCRTMSLEFTNERYKQIKDLAEKSGIKTTDFVIQTFAIGHLCMIEYEKGNEPCIFFKQENCFKTIDMEKVQFLQLKSSDQF